MISMMKLKVDNTLKKGRAKVDLIVDQDIKKGFSSYLKNYKNPFYSLVPEARLELALTKTRNGSLLLATISDTRSYPVSCPFAEWVERYAK